MELSRDNMKLGTMVTSSGRYSSELLLDWLQGGVDTNLPGNGGPGCINYRPLEVLVIDTILLLVAGGAVASWAWKAIMRGSEMNVRTLGKEHRGKKQLEENVRSEGEGSGRQLLLVGFCLMLGIIVGFKLASKQVIYLLQPCHITTAFQIYLLAARTNKHTTTLFRVHLGFLNGAVLALLFPATDVYLLPFELEIFWIQHIMMIIVPLYLISLGGPFTCEALCDLSYCGLSSSISVLFHVLILQSLSIISGININYTLCPPPSLPSFVSGPHYLLQAGWHLPLVMTIVSKVVGLISHYLPKEDITADYLPKEDITADYLPKEDITADYLPKEDITADYLPKEDVTADYLPKEDITADYLPKEDITADYLPKEDITADYLPKEDITAHYLPKEEITADYLPKGETVDHYLSKGEIKSKLN